MLRLDDASGRSGFVVMIACPHCQINVPLKPPGAGRFKARCRQCHQAFRVDVDATGGEIRVTRLKPKPSPVPNVAPVEAPVEAPTPAPTADESVTGLETAPGVATRVFGDGSPRSASEPAFDPGPSPRVDATPARLGDFRILRPIGAGAMGAVHLARQVSLDREVAVKVIRQRDAKDPEINARFVREAYAAAKLTHHNVVQVFDFGDQDGTLYYAMEWVPGGSLEERISRRGPMKPRVATAAILQAARGLRHAHAAGMVHRDIKPSNLLIGRGGVIKVADLGLVKAFDDCGDDDPLGPDRSGGAPAPKAARSDEVEVSRGAGIAKTPPDETLRLAPTTGDQTIVGTSLGTPAYMAPEQAVDSSSVDHRADIYSLGCTLVTLLTGRPPFAGKTPMDYVLAHARQPVPSIRRAVPSAGASLEKIVRRCLQKDPNQRYASLDEMIEALRDCLDGGTVDRHVPPPELASFGSLTKRFNEIPLARWRMPIAQGLLAAAAVSALFFLWAAPVWAIAPATAVLIGAATTTQVLAGRGSHALAAAVRGWLFSRAWPWWVATAVSAVLVVWSIALLQAVVPVFVGMVIGGSIAAAYASGVHDAVDRHQAAVVAEAQKVLRVLRLRGLTEQEIRQFVIDASGGRGEEFFEQLFGYAEMIAARRRRRSSPGGQAPSPILAVAGLAHRVAAASTKRSPPGRRRGENRAGPATRARRPGRRAGGCQGSGRDGHGGLDGPSQLERPVVVKRLRPGRRGERSASADASNARRRPIQRVERAGAAGGQVGADAGADPSRARPICPRRGSGGRLRAVAAAQRPGGFGPPHQNRQQHVDPDQSGGGQHFAKRRLLGRRRGVRSGRGI